jgi:hypothetical protein
MATKKPKRRKTYFTVAQANAALPLIRAIVQDITQLAADLHERHDRLVRASPKEGVTLSDAHREELQLVQADLERDQERMEGYEEELHKLGVELKDYRSGLIDFPCWMENREVYLCWRLGEPEVAHWHEVEAGFAGRQKLMADVT